MAPPLAGRPPFATDIPDSVYAQPQPQPRYRQPPRDDPNARTSAYNHYDAYLNGGGGYYDGTRAGHPAPANIPQSTPRQMPVPIVAPKPGYAAPIAALNMSQHQTHHASRLPPGIGSVRMYPSGHAAPRMPPAAARPPPPPAAPISVPNVPHPLPPTISPILPVFARPAKPSESRDVKWGPESIMRGNSEEKLIPRRGERGDDFWRRFSMVAREDSRKPYSQKQSAWLRKTQSGANRMSIWVWIVGVIIFSCAGLGIGLGWYLSHKAPAHQDPTAFGGGAGNGANMTAITSQGAGETSNAVSAPHVTPTATVARRAAFPLPFSTPAPGVPIHVQYIPHPHGSKQPSRRQLRHLKRAVV